jgi:DNA-directed RNA polymerase subunit L
VIDILPVSNPGKKRHPAKITLLIVALLVSAGWIVLGSPGTWLTLLMLLAAALSVGSLAAILLPGELTPAQKNFVGAAVGCATLLVAYLAVPGVHPSDDERTGSTSETTTTQADERTRAAEADKPAVIIRADYDWDDGDGVQWALPETPTAEDAKVITTPIDPEDHRTIKRLEDYLASRKGVKFSSFINRHDQLARVKISIQSTRENTVAVSDLRIHTISCGPPLRGGLVFGPPEGVNDLPSLAFELDTAESSAQELGEDGRFKGPYFTRKFITVGRNEPMVLLVHVFTAKRYCQWELILTTTVDGVESQYPIRRPDGGPFEATALTRSYDQAYQFDHNDLVFKKLPPGRLPPELPARTGENTR